MVATVAMVLRGGADSGAGSQVSGSAGSADGLSCSACTRDLLPIRPHAIHVRVCTPDKAARVPHTCAAGLFVPFVPSAPREVDRGPVHAATLALCHAHAHGRCERTPCTRGVVGCQSARVCASLRASSPRHAQTIYLLPSSVCLQTLASSSRHDPAAPTPAWQRYVNAWGASRRMHSVHGHASAGPVRHSRRQQRQSAA
jgi:hypothetical protein